MNTFMKSILIIAIYLIFTPSILLAWEGKVVSVSDDDTINVLSSGKHVKVRLAAIDCPENGQPWGKKAKQFVSFMVLHKTVIILPENVDRYGRIVGWVFVNDFNLNHALVREGLAWHDRRHSNNSFLTALEMEARVEKKGLWSETDPVPPWEWRKNKKKEPKNGTLGESGEYCVGIQKTR